MREVSSHELVTITGGTNSISAPIINALTNIIKVLYDAGSGLGSAIRRMSANSMCPTK
ncbi:MAG: hypothetical protein IJI43_00930 [Bacilli bacterium]|nr:hypothetical protein [Bacilli bacterium]